MELSKQNSFPIVDWVETQSPNEYEKNGGKIMLKALFVIIVGMVVCVGFGYWGGQLIAKAWDQQAKSYEKQAHELIERNPSLKSSRPTIFPRNWRAKKIFRSWLYFGMDKKTLSDQRSNALLHVLSKNMRGKMATWFGPKSQRQPST